MNIIESLFSLLIKRDCFSINAHDGPKLLTIKLRNLLTAKKIAKRVWFQEEPYVKVIS